MFSAYHHCNYNLDLPHPLDFSLAKLYMLNVTGKNCNNLDEQFSISEHKIGISDKLGINKATSKQLGAVSYQP